MDQPENNSPHNDGPNNSAGDAAARLKAEAAATLRELRGGGGLSSLFDFDRMYFPFFARTLFMIICVLAALSGGVGVIVSLITMAQLGFLQGFFMLIGIVLGVIVTVVMIRVWVELSLVAFNINEGIQEIRSIMRSKEN